MIEKIYEITHNGNLSSRNLNVEKTFDLIIDHLNSHNKREEKKCICSKEWRKHTMGHEECCPFFENNLNFNPPFLDGILNKILEDSSEDVKSGVKSFISKTISEAEKRKVEEIREKIIKYINENREKIERLDRYVLDNLPTVLSAINEE